MAAVGELYLSSVAAQDAVNKDANHLPPPSLLNGTTALTTSLEPPSQAQGSVDGADASAQQTSPAKGKGKGKGRAKAPAKAKAKITKPAGRGRRHKAYDSITAQAAHERLIELKAAWNSLTKLVKPALQELADRSLKQLNGDPKANENVPEAEVCTKFLDQRLADTIEAADRRLEADTNLNTVMLEVNQMVTNGSFVKKVHEAECDMLDTLLLRLDRLEKLHDNNLPVNFRDDSYLYKNISQTQVDLQDGYTHLPNPLTNKLDDFSTIQETRYWLPPKPSSSNKYGDDPDGQQAEGDDTVPDMPRPAGGLLSAVEDVEGRPSTPFDDGSSQTPTAGAAKGTSPVPEMDGIEEVNGLPVPRAAGPPDEFGFRVISRKAKGDDIPNNRILGPASIEFDDDDIGFRDSTNNPQKGATKARRGKYLGTTNSHAMYYDRRCFAWMFHELKEDDFDQGVVEKYHLHPRMGLFLPGASNEAEPPRDVEPGDRPIICVGPKGQMFHASRSVWGARLDKETVALDKKIALRAAIREFCQADDIPEEDIEPSQEERDEHRRALLLDRDLDPDLTTVIEEEDDTSIDSSEAWPESALRSTIQTTASDGLNQILEAASALDAADDANRIPPVPRAPSQSRPYDAIRDVFTDSAPPPPPPTRPAVVDTYSLSLLAELAEGQPRTEISNIDPRLFSPGDRTGGRMMMDYAQPSEYPRPNAFPTPSEAGPPPAPPPPPPSHWTHPHEYSQPEYSHLDYSQPREPARDNDFLRTALNPQPSSYPPLAPAPPTRGLSPPSQRVPFSNPGSTRGSLPALRPVRGLHDESQPLPEPQGSPSPMQRPGMVVSNSGAYFPPAPARPFHSGYTLVEQHHMAPMQPALMPNQQQQQLPPPPPPLQPAQPGQGQFAQSPTSYTMSPPSYHTSPPPMSGIPGPIYQQPQHPPLRNPSAQQPAALSPRARPGSSSASSKYRKLEPAPTPAHRMGYQSNGQELRTVPFDYREAIKDYSAVEAPPQHGPVHIRGWTHNHLKRGRAPGKGDSTAPDDPS